MEKLTRPVTNQAPNPDDSDKIWFKSHATVQFDALLTDSKQRYSRLWDECDMETWLLNKPTAGRADDKQKMRNQSRYKPYSKLKEKYTLESQVILSDDKLTSCGWNLGVSRHHPWALVNRHPPPSRSIYLTLYPMNRIPSPTLIFMNVLVSTKRESV